MARIPLELDRSGLLGKLFAWYSRRAFGKVVEPLGAMAHHRSVLLTMTAMELGVQRWRRLSPTLHCLALQATSAAIGCSWCLDFGFWEAHHKGVDAAKIEGVPRWRESDVYTELERLVLEYAEGMTATPPTVTDGLVGMLRDQLGDAALVELTELVAVENLRSRFNSALGLQSQGFKAECEVRPAMPA